MTRHALLLPVVALAGCAASPSSLAPNQAQPLRTSASLTTGAHEVTAPDSAKRGIYVSEYGAEPGILGSKRQ
jgi:hypothetical protein